MPPGTVGPFIMRFDAGTVPVGYLVFRSETRSLGEIQDLALNRVRPQFATLPGLTSPPPLGGSEPQRMHLGDERVPGRGEARDHVVGQYFDGFIGHGTGFYGRIISRVLHSPFHPS